jgi:lysophospholipase L1-like esterase
MGVLQTLLKKSQNRVAIANNCNLPTNYNTGANWVQNCWTKHRSGPAGYSAIEASFINGLISTNSEQSAYYDFVLRAGVLVNGQFTQLLFNGATETTVSKDWGLAVGKANVYIPPNTDFYITNRRVAADSGAAGSYKVITTTAGTTFRQDGIINGTDNTKDYTLGVGIAYGAKAGTPVVNGSGVITSIPIDSANRGTGYTAGTNLYMWYGAAGVGQPAAAYTGSGVSGFGSVSGGQLSSITVSAGGTGHTTGAPPRAFIGGTSTAATGFGTTTATYGPSLITGIPRKRTPSVLIIGDSIASGFGSVDALGDLNASFGSYEQALVNRASVNVHKMSVSGESAVGWDTTKIQQLNFMDAQIQRGMRPSHVVIALGVNDFLTNNNTDVIASTQSHISTIASLWRARGAKIILTTVTPSNTTSSGSNKFTTLAEQSPTLVSGSAANFQAGGRVEQYNSALLSGAIVSDGIIDISAYCRDTTTTSRWRVDTYGGATAFCAVDGIHPSVGVGIPYLVANMALPSFV